MDGDATKESLLLLQVLNTISNNTEVYEEAVPRTKSSYFQNEESFVQLDNRTESPMHE